MFWQKFKRAILGKRSARGARPRKRSYSAAAASRLVNSWTKQNLSADAAIYQALGKLRARSRDLAINNDYGKRFLQLIKTNVVGHKGIRLQSRVRNNSGDLDEDLNKRVEEQWQLWCRKGVCTADGATSWIATQKLILESTARDGDIMIRLLPGWKDNDFRFTLQLIETDHLDETLNRNLTNGNQIRMGVEKNKWKRPVAYWVLKNHPYDFLYGQSMATGSTHQRVAAHEIIHPFVVERAGQSRGVPWMATSAYRAWMLDGYLEAELVASRTASAKMGFFSREDGGDYTGDEFDADDDNSTDTDPPIMDAEPGTFGNIGDFKFDAWDPQHPTQAFGDFVASILRGVASGLGVSYVSLANDLRGVSYSSIRQGALEDRDHYRDLQIWMIENFTEPVYYNWLKTQILTGKLDLPTHDINKYFRPLWQPRGWEWIDPLKEITANEKAIKNLIKTLQDVVAEHGGDIYDNIEARAAMQKALDKEAIYTPGIHEFEYVTMQKATSGGPKNAGK